MTPEAWQVVTDVITTIGAVTSAVAVALITRQRGEVRRGAAAAEAARDEATTVNNGFAKNTAETLAVLDRRSRANEARLAWVTDALGQHLTMHGAVKAIHEHGRAPTPSQWWPPDDDDERRP